MNDTTFQILWNLCMTILGIVVLSLSITNCINQEVTFLRVAGGLIGVVLIILSTITNLILGTLEEFKTNIKND